MRLLIFFVTFLMADTNSTVILNMLKDNRFYVEYNNYLKYQKVQDSLYKYSKLYRKNPSKYKNIISKLKTQLELLKSDKDIYKSLVKLRSFPDVVEVNNPFQIFSALSYEKELRNIKKQNEYIYNEFKKTFNLIKKLANLNPNNKDIQMMLQDFEVIDSIYKTQLATLNSQFNAYLNEVNKRISNQINKFIFLLLSIAISVLIFYSIKLAVRKYIKSENIYFVNKILNILNVTIIVLIVLFFYINNATYLITILGFASAGIAIAMKDWFMNMFGWFVIMTSNNFKVGDRIKILLQNGQVVIIGDVIDITMTRIVIYEDVTYETVERNRRAGRVIFVPNNVIFTNPIFNYTHSGLSTVWDGIDIVITFDSNYKKAIYIAREIVSKYAKGYVDITKRRLQNLKSNYNIKHFNVDVRIYTFIDENGIRVSCWYLNNYMTLNLRSTISAELIDAFNKEDDIKIAYPTFVNKIESDNGKII